MNRLYSFVLPAYKARFLKEAIDSILAQTYTNFELIIVNDASPEDLDSIVNGYEDQRIQYYVNEKNIGGKNLVEQWNYSISYAKGEYLILASDDDVYDCEYLTRMNRLVDKYPDVNVFRPQVQMIDGNGNIIRIRGVLKEYTSAVEFAYWLPVIGSGVPFYIFKRSALLSIGGFIEYPLAWHSDDATAIMLATNGLVFCDEILFSFRFSGDSISSKKNTSENLKKKIEATISHYAKLKEMLDMCEKRSHADQCYYNSLVPRIPDLRRQMVCSDLSDSTKMAVVECFPFLLGKRILSLSPLIKICLKLICL